MGKKNWAKKNSPRPHFMDHSMPYSTLEIDAFRGIKHLELYPLADINFIFGPNNSGKTSILEAVYLHACGFNWLKIFQSLRPPMLINQSIQSGYMLKEKFLSLFYASQSPYQFKIKTTLINIEVCMYLMDYNSLSAAEIVKVHGSHIKKIINKLRKTS